MVYVLEVVRFFEHGERMDENGVFEHVGYMRARFRTKNNAVTYYDRHHPRMRSLNAHNTWRSDWDPTTRLAYIVRKGGHGIVETVAPFDPRDEPTVQRENGSVTTIYPRLS